MKLYFSPLACSMVVRVVALEMGVSLVYEQVELFAQTLTADGTPYRASAPFGQVPLLVLEDGSRLTEVAAILALLADTRGAEQLLAPVGSLDRYRTLAWLGFSATEIHKRSLWPLANPRAPREAKEFGRRLAGEAFDHLETQLVGRRFIATPGFSLADAHLGWALAVAPLLGADLGDRPALRAYAARLAERPSFEAAFAAEMPLLRPAMKRQAAHLRPVPAAEPKASDKSESVA
ncbi:MAG: glutathione S-transferase N-terminal domain-containing protein [Myxococcales bacterium]|nr:glutathione S-transferase N-terminal domain-containing protein [Myxococcales bacterium]